MKINRVVGTELYHRYPGQTQAQAVHVYLDAKAGGSLSAEYNPEVGNSWPTAVFNGHVQRWIIPALRADAANALLEEIAPVAERVVAGYTSEWDGHNHVAKFDADAKDAIEEIDGLCEQYRDGASAVVVWTASEYYGPLGTLAEQAVELGIKATTSDDTLEILAEAERSTARDNDIDEVEGLSEHLEALREAVRAEAS